MQAEFVTDAALKNFSRLCQREIICHRCSAQTKMTSYFQQLYSVIHCGTSWMPKSLSELFHWKT